MTIPSFAAGIAHNLGSFAVTVGKVISVHSASTAPAGAPVGPVPPAESPQLAVVLGSFLSSTPGAAPRTKVQILAPGLANNNRVFTVVAHTVAD